MWKRILWKFILYLKGAALLQNLLVVIYNWCVPTPVFSVNKLKWPSLINYMQILNSSSIFPVPSRLLLNSARWSQLWWAPTSPFHPDPKPIDIHGRFSQISVSFGSNFNKIKVPATPILVFLSLNRFFFFSAEFIQSEKQKCLPFFG